MENSTSHFDQRITFRQLVSRWNARSAVHDGIPLAVYLLPIFRKHEARFRPTHHYPLPSEVVIEDGNIKVIKNPDYDHYWEQLRDDPNGDEASERFQTLSMIEEFTRLLQELDAEDAQLTRALLVIRELQEALENEELDGLGTGTLRGPTTTDRLKSCRLRPRLPFPWLPVLGYTAIAAMTIVELFQLAFPFLDSIGVDTTNLPAEWAKSPLTVLAGGAFSLPVTAGLIISWHVLLRRSVALARILDSAAPRVIVRQAAGIIALCCVLLIGSLLIAGLRHGMAPGVSEFSGVQQGMGNGAFLFLTLLVPFCAAFIHHEIAKSPYWQRRRDIVAEQEQFDRAEEAQRVPGETLADRQQLIQRRRDWIENQRALLRDKRNALFQRAQAAQQQRHSRLVEAQRSTKTYARTLIATLEEHRYSFIRAAYRCKALHLVPKEARDQSMAPSQPRRFVAKLLPVARNGH